MAKTEVSIIRGGGWGKFFATFAASTAIHTLVVPAPLGPVTHALVASDVIKIEDGSVRDGVVYGAYLGNLIQIGLVLTAVGLAAMQSKEMAALQDTSAMEQAFANQTKETSK